jgi:hypothetical protein
MEMSKKKIDIGQISIFDVIKNLSEQQKAASLQGVIPGSFNIEAILRELISSALKNTKLSRYEVAAEMSKLLGREITKSQIDSWSAESKEHHRFPLAYLNAFMEATGDKTIVRLISEKAAGYFIEGEDALYTELGKIERQENDLAKRKDLIKKTLEEINKSGGNKNE